MVDGSTRGWGGSRNRSTACAKRLTEASRLFMPAERIVRRKDSAPLPGVFRVHRDVLRRLPLACALFSAPQLPPGADRPTGRCNRLRSDPRKPTALSGHGSVRWHDLTDELPWLMARGVPRVYGRRRRWASTGASTHGLRCATAATEQGEQAARLQLVARQPVDARCQRPRQDNIYLV